MERDWKKPRPRVRQVLLALVPALVMLGHGPGIAFALDPASTTTNLLNDSVEGAAATSAVASPQAYAGEPIRAAFYYPWFPEAWTQGGVYPFTNYHPSLGYYDLDQTQVIRQHIAAMQYGKITVGISSWWGQGHHTDMRLASMLSSAAGTGFRWTIYHEGEGQGDPTVSQLSADLTYIRDHYATHPAFMTIDGKFVVFVYADSLDGCGMADRWKQANTVNAYIVLKVFAGYRNCASQPDAWHQYAPANAFDQQGTEAVSISPGFWLKGNTPRLVRDLSTWKQNIRDMVASGAKLQLVTTFNEWGEGTSVESATEWETSSGYGAYLDALHNDGLDTLPPAQTFADVPPTHPYFQEIEALYRAGYTAGCSINPLEYCPDATMNRAESAVFVERGIHSAPYVPPAPTSQVFADLPLDSWAVKWVQALFSDGYTAGCGASPLVYCPWQGHTRAEGAVFYLRMLHGPGYSAPAPTGVFSDVPLEAWYAGWVEAAYRVQLIEPCSSSPLRYCPDDPLTRGLAAYMMVQAKGLPTAKDPVLVGAGDIAHCGGTGHKGTAKLLDGIPGTVFTLGDNSNDSGTAEQFANCYDPEWGRHKARTRPSAGNHDYLTTGAAGYFGYFGASAGDPAKGYYSYDLGAWHVVVINSNCSKVGGCGAGSPQEKWLRADLAAHPTACTLAYWHHPLFTSGQQGVYPSMLPIWQALYEAGADLVLNGNDHDYERFAPQTPSGSADPARGLRQFIVGTGGAGHITIGSPTANSEVRNDNTFGVLKLTLHPTGYDWEFVPEAGRTFTDRGSALCH